MTTNFHALNDSTGVYPLDPDSLPHSYTYDGSGNLLTDTVTDGAHTWVKTYAYSGGHLASETAWVKQ